MLYLRTETLSHYNINIFTPSNNNNNNNTNRLLSSNEPNTALIRWLFHTTLFPGIVLLMAIYLQNNTNANATLNANTSKWIHSCSSVLASAIATYLALMVILECTVRVLLFQAGIEIAIDPSTVSSSAYQQLGQGKHATAALDRCIERSLLQRNLEDTETEDTETGAASTGGSRCCGKQRDSNHAGSISNTSSSNSSCAICLEDFRHGDTVVSGRRDCCKSNVFHESCIKHWLRIQDSCPCCRQAMLEGPIETDQCERETERDTERDARAGRYESASTTTTANTYSSASASSDGADHERPSFRSQFRIKIDTAARMRNEIFSYYVEGAETAATTAATTTTSTTTEYRT
jgi:hypothetical protein